MAGTLHGRDGLIAPLTGELRNPGLEASFRREQARALHRLWFTAASIIAVLSLLFCLVDLASLGFGWPWALLLAGRVSSSAAALAAGFMLGHRPEWLARTKGRVLLIGAQVLVAGVALAASASRPADALTSALSLALVAMACMVFIPGRFTDQLAVGIAVCAGLVGVSITRFADPPLSTVPLVANLTAVLLLGATLRSLMNREQRQQWIALQRLTDQLTRAADLRLRLQRLAGEDALTGVANRRRFIDELSEMTGDRRRRPVVILLDLDRFKRINDTLGHPVGDQVLVAVADGLLHAVRDTDLVARIGGEEFAVAGAGQDLEAAALTAERIRRAVMDAEVPLGLPGPVTASIGVARQRPGESVEALMARADWAMYRAKRSGGNAVELAGVEGRDPADACRPLAGPSGPRETAGHP